MINVSSPPQGPMEAQRMQLTDSLCNVNKQLAVHSLCHVIATLSYVLLCKYIHSPHVNIDEYCSNM